MKRLMLWLSAGIILTTMIVSMILLGVHDYNNADSFTYLLPLGFLPVVVILIIAGIKKMYKLGRVIQIVCAPFYSMGLFITLSNITVDVSKGGSNPYIVFPVTIGCSLCLLATIILFNILKDKETRGVE